MKLVSVIIPYYRKIKFIEYCVNSVLKQTYRNIEVLIIYDDSSNLDFKKILQIKKKDKRIKIIRNKDNIGAGLSRNVGIKKSKGKLIAFLDADDYWKKNKLMDQIKFMEKNSASFVHCSYFIVNEFNKIIGFRTAPKLIEYKALINSCDIGLSTVILEKKIIKNLKFPNLKTKEDYVMWLKLSQRKIKIYGIRNKMVYWRKLDNSLSSNFLQKINDGYKVYRIYLKKNIIESFLRLFVLSLNFLRKKVS
tara:strand:+ start:150 stop:896 length:747 start_codon:yes stop_codon:yes gene_type:complete